MEKEHTISRDFIRPSYAYLIEKKRDGEEFSDDEIRFITNSILDKTIPDHQLAALAMAVYFQGMTPQEIAVFTEEMMLTGEVFELPRITKPKLDRYATGGVGDKTGLVLIPLAAACGIAVPSMIGEEEGFVISDLDKLRSIPGFQTNIPHDQFVKQLQQIGCAVIEQCSEITPINTLLFKLRKETGTVPSLPLLTSSLLSKKFSEGADGLVVDVKWGNGAYVRDVESAKQLGRMVTRVAKSMNRKCVALITDMNQPLGSCVGTGLEMQEVLQLLRGESDPELDELILRLGMEMVRLAGVAGSTLSAKQMVRKHLSDGVALVKLREMVESQGGDPSYIDDPDKFSKAKYIKKLPAAKRGYVHTIDSNMLAHGVQILARKRDGSIDHAVGVSEIKKIGYQVKQGEALMMIHYNDEINLESALEFLRSSYRLAPKRPTQNDLIVERVA
ncbi:MAG: thymidine phosphorylase [Puniceicoccales bacterium]|jgi:pyrimidine-nucleoside phosphorylase|nr:thymidine phosphorylase [Puniceicoccales bacterium]